MGLKSTGIPLRTHSHESSSQGGTVDHGNLVGLADADHASYPTQAVETALEAQTNQNTYAPPDLLQHHPGMSKAYCTINANGTLAAESYNIASITDSGTGDRVIVFDKDFSALYVPVDSMQEVFSTLAQGDHNTVAVGSIRYQTYQSASAVDIKTSNAYFGPQ